LPPAILSIFFRSSNHSVLPYVLVISIENTVYSYSYAASRVKDCRPDPPIPTSNPFPPGNFKIREIINKCSTAKLNNARSIGLSGLNWLYETKLPSSEVYNFE